MPGLMTEVLLPVRQAGGSWTILAAHRRER